MKDEMESDRAKHTVLPLSKFGLMQITRERVRPQMNIATKEVCPTCMNRKINASILVTDQIENKFNICLKAEREKISACTTSILVCLLHQRVYFKTCEDVFQIQALG